MKFENLAYSFFGNNLVIGPHIRRQINFLKGVVPDEMRGRQVDDLGCGDARVTLLLEEVFQPEKLRGFDVDPNLVRRAVQRGIDAEVMDLNKEFPGGEMAVVWGVLHHLDDFGDCLRRLKDNYPLVFIREPIKHGVINGLELGHPLRLDEMLIMLKHHFPDARIHFCGNSIMVFYACPEYVKNENDFYIPEESQEHYDYISVG